MCLHDIRRAIPPEIVVRGFNVSIGIVEPRLVRVVLDSFLFELCNFLGSQKLLAGIAGRALERCDAVVIPHALQVGMAPWRARHFPGLAGGEWRRRHQHEYGKKDSVPDPHRLSSSFRSCERITGKLIPLLLKEGLAAPPKNGPVPKRRGRGGRSRVTLRNTF